MNKSTLLLFACVIGVLLPAALPAAPAMGPQMMTDEAYRWGANGYGPMTGYGGMMGAGYGGMMGYGDMMGMMGIMDSALRGYRWLDLDDKQRKALTDTLRAQRDKHWNSMKQMADSSDRLGELYQQTPRDAKKIAAEYEKIFALKVQMIRDTIEAQNKFEGGLSEEQRKSLRQAPRGPMGYGMMR